MPLLEHREAIRRYFETIKEEYPNLTLEDIEAICRTPAEFIKKVIREGNLQDIYIKYIGKMKPNKDRLLRYQQKLNKFKELGHISEEYFDKQNKKVENKLYQISIKNDKEFNFIITK